MPQPILMFGTHMDARGGVAAVLRTWRDAGLMQRLPIRHVVTHADEATPRKLWRALAAWGTCLAAVVGGQVGLIHVHTSSYGSFWRKSPLFAMALAAGVPLVVSLHGGGFATFFERRGPVGRWWIRKVMRGAQRFVVLTPTWEKWALTVEPASRVVVIPNPVPMTPAEFDELAVDVDVVDAEDRQAVSAWLLYLGRIEAAKGVDHLFAALAQARAAGARWRLVCGGAGNMAWARSEVARLGLSDAVEFAGWVDGPAKARLLAGCSLLVLPSLAENMPLVLLEAQTYGKPVIATRVGGIPDMLTDGQEGLLVDPADTEALARALVRAWQEPEPMAAMGRRGRARARQCYHPQQVAERVANLYANVLKQSGKRSGF